jgi:tRNA pseudouridine55 synthase
MNGLLIIDKPKGCTSHDVVERVRRLIGIRKVGHAGTLDPLATGVLVLCLGQATRIVRYLESDDKTYTAAFCLGTTTDTLDSEGAVVETRKYVPPSRERLSSVLSEFSGTVLQRPPAYSALKINGVPSYRLARSGRSQLHAERSVTIHELSLIEYADPLVRIRVTCSKGTYVRALCADIGERLGTGAHLTELTRERSGAFTLEQAAGLDRFAELIASGSLQDILISMDQALARYPEVNLPAPSAIRVSHGNAIDPGGAMPAGREGERYRLKDNAGRLLAVGLWRQGRVAPEVVFG